jgi:hypothetical protein
VVFGDAAEREELRYMRELQYGKVCCVRKLELPAHTASTSLLALFPKNQLRKERYETCRNILLLEIEVK